MRNRFICTLFQWFWFGLENRTATWKIKVVKVCSLTECLVEEAGARKRVWFTTSFMAQAFKLVKEDK